MSTPRRGWLVVAGILILVLGACASAYRKEEMAYCDVCGSRRHIEIRRLFSETGPRMLFTTDHEALAVTRLCRDYFQPGHAHRREPAWTAVDGAGFFGFRATGRGRDSDLRRMYEASPALREFVHRKVAAGELTRRQVQLVFATSSIGNPPMRPRIHTRSHPPALVAPEELGQLSSAQEVIAAFLED